MSTHVRLLSLLALASAQLIGCAAAEPEAAQPAHHEYYIFVADGLPEALIADVQQRFQELLGKTALPGDVIHCVSAATHQAVASIRVPEGDRNTRFRHPSVRPELSGVTALFSSGSTSSNQQVGLSRLLSTVRALRRTEYPVRVIIIGDPIHDDPQLPGSSMRDSRYPSDGTLESRQSPYYISAQFPAATIITWLTPTANWGSTELHRQAVTRFLRLYFQEGARFIRLTSDAAAAFDFEHPQFEGTVARRNEESCMKIASVVDLQTGEGVTDDPPAPPPMEPEPTPPMPEVVSDEAVNRTLRQAETNARQIVIAIGWRSDDPATDLDIHLSDARYPGEELSFQKPVTSFGKLLRDIQKSGVTEGADFEATWECVVVNHDSLRDLTLWVNAYNLHKPATLRVIRVWNGSRHEFTVPFLGSRGDGAKDANRRHESSAWQKIRL